MLDHPDFSNYISDDALIVEDKLFERAVVRIAQLLPLSDGQQDMMAPFEKVSPEQTAAPGIDSSDNNKDSHDTSMKNHVQRYNYKERGRDNILKWFLESKRVHH